MAKFTFKRDERATGLAAMTDYGGGTIKLKRKDCGFYTGKNYDCFEVWFRINDQNSKGGWKNVRLKKTFPSEKELRTWLQEHTDGIVRILDLHFLEK